MTNVNGFDPVAWSVDGGRHSGDLLRLMAYAATGGAEGIVSPADCKPHALTTPGPQVVVDAGGLLIRNRSANVLNQTYAANGRLETRLDVAPTSSSSRSDAVIVRIEDPQFDPWPDAPVGEEATYQSVKPVIIQNVPASTTSALDLNLGYSAYMVARLDLPANTTNVTSSMVKDVRKLAQPRTWTEADVQPGAYGAGITDYITVSETAWHQWPLNAFVVSVPAWATNAQASISIVNFNVDGPAVVETRVMLDNPSGTDLYGPGQHMDYNGPTTAGVETRTHHSFAEFDVQSVRGKTVTIRPEARRLFPTEATGNVYVGTWVQVVFEIRFLERVV